MDYSEIIRTIWGIAYLIFENTRSDQFAKYFAWRRVLVYTVACSIVRIINITLNRWALATSTLPIY